MTDNDQLILRARQEAEALGRLYEMHYDMVLQYCLRRLFIVELAEDVTSAVFLRVAGHMRSFGGKTIQDFRNWLYAIAGNEVRAYLRKTSRRRELLAAAVEAGAFPDRSASGCGEDPPDWPMIYQAILQLKPKAQAMIVLRFLEHVTVDEVARIMGCSSGACRTATSRATDKLREHLSRSMRRGREGSHVQE